MSVGDDYRDSDDANPYTFEERKAMILKTIEMDEEISDRLNDIIIIPWSMNNEKDLINISNYFLKDKYKITQFMNIIPGDEWEYEKKRIFIKMGFQIMNLVDSKLPRMMSATDVRGLMREPSTYKTKTIYKGIKEVKWADLVPK